MERASLPWKVLASPAPRHFALRRRQSQSDRGEVRSRIVALCNRKVGMDEVAVAVGGAKTAGIAWFLPESHVENVPVSTHPQPHSKTSRPYSGAAHRRRRRRRSTKDNDGVNVIDIEDEDHSFASFFVGVGNAKSAAAAASSAANSSSSSEASEVKRPMVPLLVGGRAANSCWNWKAPKASKQGRAGRFFDSKGGGEASDGFVNISDPLGYLHR